MITLFSVSFLFYILFFLSTKSTECLLCTRHHIIKMDKAGQYIPFCTRMVFLKYYTPSADNQLHFWGHADRVAYVDAMNTVLVNYLEEPIILEKEEE